jgi:tetratricopeptide (TPR) repeat protein
VHFMLGEMLYQRGMSNDARTPLERAIALDPQLADAYHLLAFVYGDLGENERAGAMTAKAAELNPSYAKAEAGLSLDGYSTARYEELIGADGAASSPSVAEGGELAHYNLGLAFRQRALYDEALREFRFATERGEDSFLVNQAQAELLLLRGSSGEALTLYEGLIAQESASPKLWNELGVARHQAGDLAEAEEAYRRALEVDPTYALAWNNLGVVRHHRSLTGAGEGLEKALEEGRAIGDVWRNLALLRHREGSREESLAAYQKAVAVDASSAHSFTGLGILLMELNRPEEARTQLLQAVQVDPDLAEARYHLAFALSALGDYEGALRETKLALDLNPYIPAPRFRLLIDLQFEEASVLAPELDVSQRVQGEDAVQSFHFHAGALDSVFAGKAVTSDPSAADPARELLASAKRALDRGQLEQASADAQRAAMHGAPRIDVLLLQGDVFLARGFSGEAVERFTEALAEIAREGATDRDDELRRALYGAARSLLDLDRMPQAVEAAERLVELSPDSPDALRTLGEALSRVKDYARAAIVLEQARLHAPNDVAVLTQLGIAYAEAGDPEGAESALRRAINLDGRAIGARTELARVLAEDGRHEEAVTEYRAALTTLPSFGAAAFGLAGLLDQRGDRRSAMHVLVDLLTVDPYRLDALVWLGTLLERDGLTQEARFAYERVLRFDPNDEQARSGLGRLPGSV